ncbi:MAG: macro domain-containing protein, partial [Bacteroidota bacterium]
MGVWQGNITRLKVDAIVNAANKTLAGGGGVDGAIHRAAGPKLKEACLVLSEVSPSVRCPVGEARITEGFKLPAQHVIHAVGPVWRGGDDGERELLAAAYRNSLALAAKHELATIAFPAISTGAFGFPTHEAARIAIATTAAFQARQAAPERVV